MLPAATNNSREGGQRGYTREDVDGKAEELAVPFRGTIKIGHIEGVFD
jgi:hypothetical protein